MAMNDRQLNAEERSVLTALHAQDLPACLGFARQMLAVALGAAGRNPPTFPPHFSLLIAGADSNITPHIYGRQN